MRETGANEFLNLSAPIYQHPRRSAAYAANQASRLEHCAVRLLRFSIGLSASQLSYRTYVLKKCWDEQICSMLEHVSIRLQWHLPFVTTVWIAFSPACSTSWLLNALHRFGEPVLMRKAQSHSGEVRLRGRTGEVAAAPY